MQKYESLSPRLQHYVQHLDMLDDLTQSGRVSQIIGLTIESIGPITNIGDLCLIQPRMGSPIPAEVVGFRDQKVLLMPLADITGIGPGSHVTATGRPLKIPVGPSLLGRILDGLGQPMDGQGPITAEDFYSINGRIPSPLERQRITEPLSVGVRAIDGLLSCGKGQRIGVFAGSGVGKSTLLGMMARNTEADVNVIALIGERGREVREFLERDLGPEGLARSVVIVATSDQPALVRIKGAMVASTVAEYFRDQGLDVLFMMDSVTRVAIAQREVGLAVGEPPATRGYTPSVFALLPRLLERTGPGINGTITGFYTVLVEGDDMNEPVADTVRGILDGHIVLARELAEKQHYPAIDVLASVSRLMTEVADPEHKQLAGKFRSLLAVYRDAEDLINIGAYVSGSNEQIDLAIDLIDDLNGFLQQSVFEKPSWAQTVAELQQVFNR
ncbi:MAG: flagellar protein export ATPase FliI [Firmicutes bacterium]|nr:flagellar protein export ATPase FliI [Bacillota bacterium]